MDVVEQDKCGIGVIGRRSLIGVSVCCDWSRADEKAEVVIGASGVQRGKGKRVLILNISEWFGMESIKHHPLVITKLIELPSSRGVYGIAGSTFNKCVRFYCLGHSFKSVLPHHDFLQLFKVQNL